MRNHELDSSLAAPLDSRQLRAFVILARTERFGEAAKELCLSPSAVSHAMKALEQQIGCSLFTRVGKRAALTLAGEQLLHHAEKILSEMASARTSLRHLGEWGKSRLRIGADSTACRYVFPGVLREFFKDFPQCMVRIVTEESSGLLALLERREIDLALLLAPREAEAYDLLPLFSDELVFLLPPSHSWAQTGVVRAEIPKQNYILYPQGSVTMGLIHEYFGREKITLKPTIEVGSAEAIKEMVKMGLGIGILARWMAEGELQAKELVAVPLGKRKLKRAWALAGLRDRRRNIAEETFVRLCEAHAARMMRGIELS